MFQVKREDQQEADRVLENYVRKKVKDILYQARVDAVKVYYKDVLKQNLDDKLARPIELTYEQYLNGRVKWCKRAAWPSLCRYWCSEEFLTKRKRGQESRLSSDDNQNLCHANRCLHERLNQMGELNNDLILVWM